MNIKKLLSLILTIALLLSSLYIPATALSAPVGAISGESGRFYESITLPDGTDTGVRYTQMNLSGTYGSGKVLAIAEGDLSDTRLSIDVINCGTYTVSTQTVASASAKHSKNGKTVLAALNGDLWMTGVNSNSNVTKSVLKTTRGIMIIDREIWATQEFGMENYQNTSGASTVASLKSAFGVTDKNQPIVGAPVITVKITNETRNTTVTPDGLNRLPAWDSMVVYNYRINSLNYALNDSYEIALTTDNSSFTLDNKVTARVSAIYPSGSTNRPAIDKNTIVITARGSRMAELSSFKIGDTVSFDLSLVDKHGSTDLWQTVVDAIGGHMHVIKDDKQTMLDTRSSEYPTSLIGIKDDGTVMLAAVNSAKNGEYKGLRYKDAYKLCKELGYNNVFYLDGGGSSAIVTLKDGTYTQRNYSADGSARAVINAVALVWNDTPVCEKQGSLSYITTSDELSSFSPAFIPAGMLERVVDVTNCLDYNYLIDEKLLAFEPTEATNDPYASLDMTKFSEYIDTSKYKYVTLKLRTNIKRTSNFALYYVTSTQNTIYNISTQITPQSGYMYVTFNMTESAGWSGALNFLRLDFFEGIISSPGEYLEIEYLAFSPTPRDVALLKNGSYPEGAILDYYAYKDCKEGHDYSDFKAKDSEKHTAQCSRCMATREEAHVMDTGELIAPTCTQDGIVVHRCKVCKFIMKTVPLPPSGHTFSDKFTVDKEPTALESGQKSRHCLYCEAVTDVTVIPALSVFGDINGDGIANGIDSNILSKIIAGIHNQPYANADLNGDGSVNAMDCQLMKRLLAGII